MGQPHRRPTPDPDVPELRRETQNSLGPTGWLISPLAAVHEAVAVLCYLERPRAVFVRSGCLLCRTGTLVSCASRARVCFVSHDGPCGPCYWSGMSGAERRLDDVDGGNPQGRE